MVQSQCCKKCLLKVECKYDANICTKLDINMILKRKKKRKLKKREAQRHHKRDFNWIGVIVIY